MCWGYEGLNECVWIGGASYRIVTDFKNWLRFLDMMDSHLHYRYKVRIALEFFIDPPPDDSSAAVKALVNFALCRNSGEAGRMPKNAHSSNSAPVLDIKQDWAYIYAAFRQVYNINLNSENLHWHEFWALLNSLRDCTLTDIIHIRGLDISEFKDPKAKRNLRRLKKLYALKSVNEPDAGTVFGAF